MNTEGKVWNNMIHLELEPDKYLKIVPIELKIGGKSVIEFVKQNKATILAVSYSSFSDSAIDSFFGSISSSVPKIIIQPILNPLKWLIWSKFVPKKKDYFAIRGDIPFANDIFGMENKYAGYVFLINSSGMIVWKAAGPATEQELKELHQKIKSLTSF